MKNTIFRVFTKNIFAYTTLLIICLLFISFCPKVEARDKISVSMFPYSSDFRKDRKLLRNISVPIMNTDSLKLIKYERTYSALRKNKIDINSLNATNVISNVATFQSRFIILPTITIITNISIEIDEKVIRNFAVSTNATDTNTSIYASSSTNRILDNLDIETDIRAEMGENLLGSDNNGDESDSQSKNIELMADIDVEALVRKNGYDNDGEDSSADGNAKNGESGNNGESEGYNEDDESDEENEEISIADEYGITNIQLLEYVNNMPTTNFITNISSFTNKIFIARLNTITETNALIFVTNTSQIYNFDVIDTQATNILYSTNITATNQFSTVSTAAINTLEFYLASNVFSELSSLTTNSQDKSRANFWVERKSNTKAAEPDTNNNIEEPNKSSWTSGRIPTFSISSSSKASQTSGDNDEASDSDDKAIAEGFQKVDITDDEPVAIFDIGDSIKFDFEVLEQGYVNILYMPPPSTNMSLPSTNMNLLYPNNYNMGYATNNNELLYAGSYQVPTEDNNIELILREAGVSKVYFIYTTSKDALYDLTKLQTGGFLLIRDTLDFAWHLEDFYDKHKKSKKNDVFFINEIIIETRDRENLEEIELLLDEDGKPLEQGKEQDEEGLDNDKDKE